MVKILKSAEFGEWLENLRDRGAQIRIAARLVMIEKGSFGDMKSVGSGIAELRFHFGPGYRVYIKRKENTVVLLLCGGDKSTQSKDIARAKEIATTFEE